MPVLSIQHQNSATRALDWHLGPALKAHIHRLIPTDIPECSDDQRATLNYGLREGGVSNRDCRASSFDFLKVENLTSDRAAPSWPPLQLMER